MINHFDNDMVDTCLKLSLGLLVAGGRVIGGCGESWAKGARAWQQHTPGVVWWHSVSSRSLWRAELEGPLFLPDTVAATVLPLCLCSLGMSPVVPYWCVETLSLYASTSRQETYAPPSERHRPRTTWALDMPRSERTILRTGLTCSFVFLPW